MSIITSYVVSLQTNKSVGGTQGDKSVDSVSSLKQAINNTLGLGTVHRFDIELYTEAPLNSREINLTALGLVNIRTILLKSDYQFGYSLSESTPSSNPYYLARTVFIDFSDREPTIGFDNNLYESPRIITLQNQLSLPQPTTPLPITIQLIVVSYTPYITDT